MSALSDIPATEHYALLTINRTTVHHEGDERSRTHPGHGYPAYTETIESVQYKAFNTEDELKAYIQRWHKAEQTYRVLKVQPLRVTTSFAVSVSP